MASDAEKSDNEKGQVGTPTVSVKCRPNRLYKLVEKLNPAQKAAVQRIRFGGLLHLKLRTYPLAHVPKFVEAFSDGSSVFRASESKQFTISKHDVYDCFMLLLGPKEIEIVPTGYMPGSQDEQHKALKNRWRKKYNLKSNSDCIALGVVFNHIETKEFEDGGDEFCRLFVLLVMSLFLTPTISNGIEFKLLKAVEDVSAIQQYDWCSYVLNCMVSAVADGHKAQSHLLGCVPFLMITYFQRFAFQGSSCPHELPLIQYWDRKSLTARLKDELDNGPLGRLNFCSVNYPRCLQEPSSSSSPRCLQEPSSSRSPGKRKTVLGITIAGEPQPTEDEEELTSKNVTTNLPPLPQLTSKKFIQIELPAGVEDDEELKARAVDVSLLCVNSIIGLIALLV